MNLLLLLGCGVFSLVAFFGEIKLRYRFLFAFLAVACFVNIDLDLSSRSPSISDKKKLAQSFIADQDSFRTNYSEFVSLLQKYRKEEISLRLKHDSDLYILLNKLHGRPVRSLSDCHSLTLWHSHLLLENNFKCALALYIAMDRNYDFDDLIEFPYLYKSDDDFAFLLRSFTSLTNSLRKSSFTDDIFDSSFSIKNLSGPDS